MPTRRYPRDTFSKEAGQEERACSPQRGTTKMSANMAKPLTFRFIENEADVRLELRNDADHALKCVEILTVFLKDRETPGAGLSQANIRSDAVGSIRQKGNVVFSHKTWVTEKMATAGPNWLGGLKE